MFDPLPPANVMTNLELLNLMEDTLKVLPRYLDEPGWRTFDLNAKEPRVARLRKELPNGGRVYLHKTEPLVSVKTRGFFHPHAAPSCVLILKGRLLHQVGYGPGPCHREFGEPVTAMMQMIGVGTNYTINHPHLWHSSVPMKRAYSVMVTGKFWEPRLPPVHKAAEALSHSERDDIIADFKSLLRN